MTIPPYWAVAMPLLRIAADGQEHTVAEAERLLAEQFHLTDAEREQLLPSGGTRMFHSRISWARTYLQKAGLLFAPRRGAFCITPEGQVVVSHPPAILDKSWLDQFPKLVAWKSLRRSHTGSGTEPATDQAPSDVAQSVAAQEYTPSEQIESGYLQLRRALEEDVLAQLRACSPARFEQVVVDLLVKMGYGGSREGAGRALGRAGDEGIDGVIDEDPLGLDVVYIQAKRWNNGTVGRPEIQRFVGALAGQRARKGVFLTTTTFSEEARRYARGIDSKVVLIDGSQLAQLMVDHNVGVAVSTVYEIKRIDSDYFADE